MSSPMMSSMPASTTPLTISTGKTQALASNLNKSRCPYCKQIDHHEICPAGAKCRVCGYVLQRAQEALVLYNAHMDNAARSVYTEKRSLYEDAPADTPVDVKPRRSQSQESGLYGSDRNASEKKQMDLLAAKAAKALRAQQEDDKDPDGTDDTPGPYGTRDPDAASSSGNWKRPRRGLSRREKKYLKDAKKVAELDAALAAANSKQDSSGAIGARGVAVDTARRLLDDRIELIP
eukprot:14078777-Heterocapsa_arctica.AAC.1